MHLTLIVIFIDVVGISPSSATNAKEASTDADSRGHNFLRSGIPDNTAARLLATCPTKFTVCQTRPTLQKSSSYSASVVELQCMLNQKNAAGLVTDGYFGSLTDAAVKAWQTKKGLVADGIVGCFTWKNLCISSGSTTYTVSPPNSFCPTSKCFWPSATYISQVTKTAFNSGTSSYAQLAKSNAATYSVHPGLLVAHMVRESSLGLNNKCVATYQKTSLTGCGWPPSCSSGCTCSGSSVWSDQGQVSCTAQTDKNAYNEAKTGKTVGNGAYVKCSSWNYRNRGSGSCC